MCRLTLVHLQAFSLFTIHWLVKHFQFSCFTAWRHNNCLFNWSYFFMVLELQKQRGFYLLTFSSCVLTKRIPASGNKIKICTCSSIFSFSLVSLMICFRQMSVPVRVALPEELQSPPYVGKLGRPLSLQKREIILID